MVQQRLAKTTPQAWSYSLKAVQALSVGGALVSAYLAYIRFTSQAAYCAGIGDCELVNSSRYSEVLGVPVAVLGLAMYLALLFLSTASGLFRSNLALLGVFSLSLTGAAYSAYLTYAEVYLIGAICPWCIASAIIVTAILAFSMKEVLSAR